MGISPATVEKQWKKTIRNIELTQKTEKKTRFEQRN
jgi:hypothetical protein